MKADQEGEVEEPSKEQEQDGQFTRNSSCDPVQCQVSELEKDGEAAKAPATDGQVTIGTSEPLTLEETKAEQEADIVVVEVVTLSLSNNGEKDKIPSKDWSDPKVESFMIKLLIKEHVAKLQGKEQQEVSQ